MPGIYLVRALGLLVLVPVLLLVGCSSKDAASNKVKGKVTWKNEPLKGGSITFVSAADKQQRATTLLNMDGTYEMTNAPVGEVKISLSGPSRVSSEHPPTAGGAKAMLTSSFPEKYKDPEKSGLTYTVTSEATQEKNFDLP
jgi:hypothetical protein